MKEKFSAKQFAILTESLASSGIPDKDIRHLINTTVQLDESAVDDERDFLKPSEIEEYHVKETLTAAIKEFNSVYKTSLSVDHIMSTRSFEIDRFIGIGAKPFLQSPMIFVQDFGGKARGKASNERFYIWFTWPQNQTNPNNLTEIEISFCSEQGYYRLKKETIKMHRLPALNELYKKLELGYEDHSLEEETISSSTDISVGDTATAKCVKTFGACQLGKEYTGTWKQAAFSHQLRLDLDGLPSLTVHPSIFFNKTTKKIEIDPRFELVEPESEELTESTSTEETLKVRDISPDGILLETYNRYSYEGTAVYSTFLFDTSGNLIFARNNQELYPSELTHHEIVKKVRNFNISHMELSSLTKSKLTAEDAKNIKLPLFGPNGGYDLKYEAANAGRIFLLPSKEKDASGKSIGFVVAFWNSVKSPSKDKLDQIYRHLNNTEFWWGCLGQEDLEKYSAQTKTTDSKQTVKLASKVNPNLSHEEIVQIIIKSHTAPASLTADEKKIVAEFRGQADKIVPRSVIAAAKAGYNTAAEFNTKRTIGDSVEYLNESKLENDVQSLKRIGWTIDKIAKHLITKKEDYPEETLTRETLEKYFEAPSTSSKKKTIYPEDPTGSRTKSVQYANAYLEQWIAAEEAEDFTGTEIYTLLNSAGFEDSAIETVITDMGLMDRRVEKLLKKPVVKKP